MPNQWFYNTLALLKSMIVRDWLRLLLWVLGVSLFSIVVGAAFPALYSDPLELQAIAEVMKNPAMVLMFGPVFGEDNYTIAVAMSNQMLVFSMLIMGIMSIFITTRYTRSDEEDGILELIRSLPVGRLANTLAAIILMVMMNLIVGFLLTVGLWAIPDESFTFIGSLNYGLACAAGGILIGSLSLIVVQLFENNRIVMSLSFLVLGILYIGRGLADVSESFAIWIIPYNWPLRSEVFVANNIYYSLLTFLVSLVALLFALRLNVKRDIETGLFAVKKGNQAASKFILSELGFTLRLMRSAIIAWMMTLFVLGITYGAIFGDLDTFIQSNDIFQEMLPGGDYELTVQFMSVIMVVMAIMAGIGPIMLMNRLASEERKNFTEHLYARAIYRHVMYAVYLAIAFASMIVFLYLGAMGLYVGILFSMDEPMALGYILSSASAYIPALLFMLSIAALMVGFIPKYTALIWFYFTYSFFAVYLGQIIGLPSIFESLTPFGHVAQLPIEEFTPLSSLVLVLGSFIMITLGLLRYQRRDLIG